MIAVIVLLDQIVWRPVIAWAEKFKMEQVESTDAPQSWFLNLIERSRLLVRLRKRVVNPLRECLAHALRPSSTRRNTKQQPERMEGLGRAAHRLAGRASPSSTLWFARS